jgi:PEP-CTERM motif
MSLARISVAAAALVSLVSLASMAHAGPTLNQPVPQGATIEDFSGFHGAVNGHSVLGGLASFSGTGTVYREGAGESSLQGANNTVGYWLVAGRSAQPFSGSGNWLNFGNGQSAVLNFANPMSYVGFLWGSVDSHNLIEIVDGDQVLAFRGGNAGLASGQVAGGAGDRFAEQYFGYGGSHITSLRFRSSGTAFEVDRLATVSAVPEPGTLALVLAGLGAVGFIARRRTKRG